MATHSDPARTKRFEELAAEIWVPLRKYLIRRCEPNDLDDVAADVLLVLWRRLDSVPPDGVLPWTYKVAHNCLANLRRSHRRQLALADRLRLQAEVSLPEAVDERLGRALAGLREQDSEILRLWAWEGLEPRDLALVLDCSSNAAAVRLSRARDALGKVLGKDPGVSGQIQGEEEEVSRS